MINVLVAGALHEMRMRLGDCGVIHNHGETAWKLLQLLYADDAVLFANSEEELDGMVDQFDNVCRRIMLKVNMN